MDIITYALLKGKIKKASEELSQLEQEVDILNGDSSTPGSVQYQIAEVIAGAPEEYDTLLEIAQWLSEHEDDYTAVIEDIIDLKAQKTALKNADGTYNSELTIGEGLIVDNNILKLNPVQVTQAEYDALTPEEQNNGTVYYIIDAGSSGDIAAGTAITITVMQGGTKQISVELADDVSDDELPITSKAVKDALAAQQLTAGTNISIDNGVISATDTKYTAGSNISIDANNVISADAAAYTAGTNISINNNVISATDTTYTAGSNITIDANNEISATDTVYTAGNGITINANNEITVNNPIPSVTTADAGKVLMVNGQGTWAASDVYSDTIIFTYDEDTEAITCNKTNEQLLNVNEHDKFELVVTPKIAGATPETVANLYQVVTKTDSITFIFVAPNKIYSIDVDSSTMTVGTSITKVTGGDNVTLAYDAATDSLQISTNANTKKQEVTQAQYDALTTAQKKNGTVYFITDAQGGGGGNYSAGTGIDITNNVISIAPDAAFSSTSENAVQNKVVAEALETLQPALTAGTNITIDNNTISATDTTYSAGTGINIDSNNHINNLFTVNNDVLTYNGTTINPKTEATAVTYATTTNISDALDNVANNINNVATVVNGHTTQIQNLQGSLSTATTAIGDLTTAVSDIDGKFANYLPKTNPVYNGTFSTNTSNAIGNGSIALGYGNQALGVGSIAIGDSSTAEGDNSFALGTSAYASTSDAFAIGYGTKASDKYSYAEGYFTNAASTASHAEGHSTTAAGDGAHAEGFGTLSNTLYSHSEGLYTTASGSYSHAEGGYTLANNFGTHTEGLYTTASGKYSHAGGLNTIANKTAQTAIGKYNSTVSDALFIVGNGTTSENDEVIRSNAFVVKDNGNIEAAGNITLNYNNNSYNVGSTLNEVKEATDILTSNAYYFINGNVTYDSLNSRWCYNILAAENENPVKYLLDHINSDGDMHHINGMKICYLVWCINPNYTPDQPLYARCYENGDYYYLSVYSNELFLTPSPNETDYPSNHSFVGYNAIISDGNRWFQFISQGDYKLPELTASDANKVVAVNANHNGYELVQNLHNYSTTEQVVGKWIDGTTDVYEIIIYDNTINITAQTSQVIANIPNIDIVVSAEGCVIESGGITPIGFAIGLWINNGDVYILTEGNRSYAGSAYITLRYTKSTTP